MKLMPRPALSWQLISCRILLSRSHPICHRNSHSYRLKFFAHKFVTSSRNIFWFVQGPAVSEFATSRRGINTLQSRVGGNSSFATTPGGPMRRLATSPLRCPIKTLSAILIRHLERQPQRPHEHWASPIASLLGSLRSRLRTSLRSAPLRAPPSTPASQKRGPHHSILDPIHDFLSLICISPLQLSLALQWSNFRVRLNPSNCRFLGTQKMPLKVILRASPKLHCPHFKPTSLPECFGRGKWTGLTSTKLPRGWPSREQQPEGIAVLIFFM